MTTGIQKFTVFALAILVSWIAGASVPPTWSINRVTLDVLTDDDGRLYYLSEGSPAYFEAVSHRAGAARCRGARRLRRIAGGYRGVRLGGGVGRRADADRLLPARRATSLGLVVAAAGRGGGDAVLAHPRAGHLAGRRHRLGRAAARQVRHHRRGDDPVTGIDELGRGAAALPLAAWRPDGRLVAHRSRAGVRRVHDREVRARPEERQAGGLVARHRLLPGRNGKHRGGRHHRQAHRRQGARQPRGAGLHRRLDRLADRLAARLQRVAGLRPGVHLRLRGQLPRHRGRPHRLLLPERAVLLLRHLRRAGDVSAERREAALPRQAPRARPWRALARRAVWTPTGPTPLSAKRAAGQPRARGLFAPHVLEFFLPLGLLIGVAVGTFVVSGSPNVQWAFGAALLLACGHRPGPGHVS